MELKSLVVSSNTEIGSCVSRNNNTIERIYCLGNDGLNFCCRHLSSAIDLFQDTGVKVCCSYGEYSDQVWIILATIQGMSALLTVMFILLLIVVGWFFYIGSGVREVDVKAIRHKRVLKDVLRKQILYKPRKLADLSVVEHVKKLSKSITDLRRRRNGVRKELKEKVKVKSPHQMYKSPIRSPRSPMSDKKSPKRSSVSSIKSPSRNSISSSKSPPITSVLGSKSPQKSFVPKSPTKSPILSLKSPSRSPVLGSKSPQRSPGPKSPTLSFKSPSNPQTLGSKSPLKSSSPEFRSSVKSPFSGYRVAKGLRGKSTYAKSPTRD